MKHDLQELSKRVTREPFAPTGFYTREQKKLAQKKLAWLEAQSGAILDASLDGIVVVDTHGRILEFNPAAEHILGYSRPEVMGRELAEVMFPARDRGILSENLRQFQKTGLTGFEGKRRDAIRWQRVSRGMDCLPRGSPRDVRICRVFARSQRKKERRSTF